MYKSTVSTRNLPRVMVLHLSAIRVLLFHTSSIRVVSFREKRKIISIKKIAVSGYFRRFDLPTEECETIYKPPPINYAHIKGSIVMRQKYKGINTQLVHAGEPYPLIEGAVSLPIFQSSTFEYGGSKQNGPPHYIRLNNTPNHTALHEKLRLIEGGEAALVTASGMAAISTALFAVLKPGDRLLVQSDLYGGTHSFVTDDLPELGIGVDFIDADNQ